MPSKGITGAGYVNKWIFGSGSDGDVTIDNPHCIYGLPDFAGLAESTLSSRDFHFKNLTVNSTLVPAAQNSIPNQYGSFRLFVRDTLTLNPGGYIDMGGKIINGNANWDSAARAWGYYAFDGSTGRLFGTLGGSGSGGVAEGEGTVRNGLPLHSDGNEYQYGGGSGGAGGSISGGTAGLGGVANFDFAINSLLQPSVMNDATILKGYTDQPSFVFPTRIWGGAGGGGLGGGDGSSGGGCAGGGVCYIAANRIVFAGGSIKADGQSAAGTNGCGGGGGGVVILVASEIIFDSENSYVSAAGGTGGGLGAENGSSGRVLVFSDQLVSVFAGLINQGLYNTALKAYQT